MTISSAHYRFAWIGFLLLLTTGCTPSIAPSEHPAARSSVYGGDKPGSKPITGVLPLQPQTAGESRADPATATLSPPTPIQRPDILGVSSHRPRYALVIGNSEYSSQALKNPAHNAGDIASSLKRLDFDVTLELDAGYEKMEGAVRSFGRKLGPNAVGLFYYAGHAVQHEGENYLIPVDVLQEVSAPEHLRYKTVNAGYVLGVMENAGNGLNIVILDACRDNPFQGFSRSLTRGLARMPEASGALIAYSTSPGKIAEDGSGRNSPFTRHLLRYISERKLTIEAMFKNVMRDVKLETEGRQVPWYSTSMEHEFYFKE